MNACSSSEAITFWVNAMVLSASIATAWLNLLWWADDLVRG
jgi:hypothetical protein